jgi:DNA-directed RNA polymerase alpha subunit
MMQISYTTNASQSISLPAKLPAWNWQRDRREYETTEARSLLGANGFDDIDSLFAPVRASNCLKTANIRTIADLVQKTESELLKTKNFG